MRYRVELEVMPRAGLADPQGRAVEGALPALGWANVSDVRVGKLIRLTVDAPDAGTARRQVEEMAARFLSNPVIEDARVLEADPA